MTYKKIVEDFLSRGLKPSAASEYRYKLNVFRDYLMKKFHMDDTNYLHILNSLKPDDFIESVEHYIKSGVVKYKLTAEGYYAAITSFFNFLHSLKYIDNEMFSKNPNKAELKLLVDDTIKKHELKAKQVFPPLSDEEIETLIERCNEILNDSDSNKFTFSEQQKYNKQFSLFMSAIIVKIIIFSGVSNDILLSMQISDVNTDSAKISISGYQVHLPDELARQIRRYIAIREKIIQDETNTLLFFSAETLKNSNNGQIMKVLREQFAHSRAMSIAKHAIMRQIQNNIPLDIITAFTGYSGDVLGHCLEIYYNQEGVSAQKVIDIGLQKDSYFDNL